MNEILEKRMKAMDNKTLLKIYTTFYCLNPIENEDLILVNHKSVQEYEEIADALQAEILQRMEAK